MTKKTREDTVVGDATVGDATATPPVRFESLLRLLEAPLLWLDRLVERVLPTQLNPFAHSGAIANLMLVVAIATGAVLLFWYSPSVHKAHTSVLAMDNQPYGLGLLRSLHRYSSDACLAFALYHGFKLMAARRFAGARWIAWLTGIFAITLLWIDGWLGYWLVWDTRAQQIALGSARFLDLLPIVTEPLSREFLTNESINSLLFFMVFFAHMLIPMAMAVALWIHIVRLNRSHFFTGKTMSLWCLGTLLALCLVFPASATEAANMAVEPQGFTMDWWYMLPLMVVDRLSGAAMWVVALVSGVALYTIPWTLQKKKVAVPAVVKDDSCNACRVCFEDCPYEAITMIKRPKTSKRKEPTVAMVDPSKCVGCGICAGSCNTAGIELPWLDVVDRRQRMDQWLDEGLGEATHVAYLCAESGAVSVTVDPATGESPELPGYRVQSVPCAGWVHPLTVERALRHGAQGVLIVACPEGNCSYREGTKWTRERLEREREPKLRDKVDDARIRLVELARSERSKLPQIAASFAAGDPTSESKRASKASVAGGVAWATVLGLLVYVLSDLAYPAPERSAELVVSFNHPGQVAEKCEEISAEEQAKLPQHMRKPVQCERQRQSVRLRVSVDGERVLEGSYEPSGFSGDGRSLAIERIPLEEGTHQVRVEIGDGADTEVWDYVSEQEIELLPAHRHVVLFEQNEGFAWH